MLDFHGFSYKNILTYSVRDLLVILGQILWFLVSLTRRKKLFWVKAKKIKGHLFYREIFKVKFKNENILCEICQSYLQFNIIEKEKILRVLPHWFNFVVGKGVEDTFHFKEQEIENPMQTSLNNIGYLLPHVSKNLWGREGFRWGTIRAPVLFLCVFLESIPL